MNSHITTENAPTPAAPLLRRLVAAVRTEGVCAMTVPSPPAFRAHHHVNRRRHDPGPSW
ncbi:hypothetical protein AB0G71_22895 [Streptomyces sp. NPDC020403]|uniref:hypothetical protein n=1 Tax=unclassified Streptomyces TaxID=2593676 RepID=UPI0033DEA65D